MGIVEPENGDDNAEEQKNMDYEDVLKLNSHHKVHIRLTKVGTTEPRELDKILDKLNKDIMLSEMIKHFTDLKTSALKLAEMKSPLFLKRFNKQKTDIWAPFYYSSTNQDLDTRLSDYMTYFAYATDLDIDDIIVGAKFTLSLGKVSEMLRSIIKNNVNHRSKTIDFKKLEETKESIEMPGLDFFKIVQPEEFKSESQIDSAPYKLIFFSTCYRKIECTSEGLQFNLVVVDTVQSDIELL